MSTTPRVDDALLEVVGQLAAEGWPAVEAYAKSGRSRTLSWTPGRQVTTLRHEQGWAARAGDDRRSLFHAESGPPRADAAWPAADGHGLRLPAAEPVPGWSAPADVDAPLAGENEARALLRGIERALDTELPGARLLHGTLEDGSSEAQLASSRGVRARVRQRTASIYLEAIGPDGPLGGSVSLVMAGREARRFHPVALARRLADRLLVVRRGQAPSRDRGTFLLAPPVMARLLAALEALWLGPDAVARLSALTDRRGRLGGPALTVIDNGRLAGGILEAPVDGEGLPTREVLLVEEGVVRQPLVAWWQATPALRPAGCSLRAGWRDLPAPGPTHLFLRPDPSTPVAALLEDVSRGYYLLDVEGPARVAADHQRFALPVCGFAIDGGQSTGAVTGAWLVGSVRAFLAGVAAVARDLTFLPLGGMVGAPTTVVRGLELRQRP